MSPPFTVEAAVLLCLLGFAVGVFGTLVGAGGGFILTPVLLLVYPKSTPALITAISLIVVFFNAGSGSVAYARQKRIDYRSGGVVVGFVSSFLGIGGGVVHVPLLVTVLGFPTHIATATSHFVLAWMALVATLTHVVAGTFHGGVGLRRAAALSVGVVFGAQLGAILSQRLSGTVIQRLLAAGLLVLGLRLVLSVVL
jgi:uncharacterized membrane protein YfcA